MCARLERSCRADARESMLMTLFEAGAVGPRIGAITLVVHDRQDAMSRFDDGQAFADAIPGARLLATDGLGHRKILKDAGVLEAIARLRFSGQSKTTGRHQHRGEDAP